MSNHVIAIVGRPNVGKSTFFNRLLKKRKAIVGSKEGITRDRLYGDIDWSGDQRIGGWYWVDGSGADTVPDGEYDLDEFIDASNATLVEACGDACSGDAEYAIPMDDSEDYYKELGSGDDRSFSNELEEVIFNTGFEYWYTDNFVLRCGYIYDKEGDIKAPTFGAGLRFSGYGFDFGYTAGEKNHPRTNYLFFSIALEI